MRFLKSIYLAQRLFFCLSLIVFLFVLGYFYPILVLLAKLVFLSLITILFMDLLLLFRVKRGLFANRQTAARFSNGDDNDVQILVESFYTIPIKVVLIDELPFQFQIRNQRLSFELSPRAKKFITYNLRPVERGEYIFGAINLYATTPLGLARRRFRFSQQQHVAVYPSYIQMRKYELLAISNRLAEGGVKKIRRLGHTLEFERIREYVQGDDYRTINWKATARRAGFMVNEYQDERSQRVYCVVDMGRVMKLPFEGMTLLDYAINASLVMSSIAIRKQDKAGIITFSRQVGVIVPADRKYAQLQKIMEVLYKQSTQYLESNYELLFATIRQKINQRSLLLLFTNFETLSSMRRQLSFMRRIAQQHLLVAIFFENTELKCLLDQPVSNTEDIYIKTIAEKFAFEKRQIVKELSRYGIHSILTPPDKLTVNTINKYVEFKAMGII